MTKAVDDQNLSAVKTAMAEKYESLARVAKSRVKRRTFTNNAVRYRQQAAVLKARA